MFDSHSHAVGEILRIARLLSDEELAALEEEHRTTGKPLADLAVERGVTTASGLLDAVADSLGCQRLRELPASLPGGAVSLMTAEQARGHGVIPLRADARSVDLLVADPFNDQIVDDLRFKLGRDVRRVVGEPSEVEALIRQHYGEKETTLEDVLRELAERDVAADESHLTTHDLEVLAGQTPVVRFVNLVLGQAVSAGASDIHLEPFEHEFKIRCRVDGALDEMASPPKAFALPVTSRIKVLANLNIAERRLPQDGRIKITLAGRAVELRVSTLPTQFGESVVLRVLDQEALGLEITQLGMRPEVKAQVEEIVRRPHGIFVVTGPTGSGKTTTLYSALRLINRPELKILTVEDPVEYEIEGVMQVPVNLAAGLTFASALRAFLRQDPDVIMIGEIRDAETAQIAVQAALTGHLVLTTLHTNDAAGAVARLIDLGVEPFLIASTLEGVLAQRLLRRVCPDCREAYSPPRSLGEESGGPSGICAGEGVSFYRGKGCPHCEGSGFRGRRGIFEWMKTSEPLRELITAKAAATTIRRKAAEEGMRSLREDAMSALLAGETTVEEVLKHT